MADAKLSALTELAVTPADDDEVYIRDVSEAEADESKRITIANLVGDVSKVIWKDASEQALSDLNRTSDLSWTDLDLTAYTSANAKFAILALEVTLDSYTSGFAYVYVRKNGTTPTRSPKVWAINLPEANYTQVLTCIIGLDSGQVIEYYIRISDTAQVDTRIDVLGYIE